jgi:outer membrane murein-binding lipoprotein Lpp
LTRRHAAPVAALAALSVLAGCGDSNEQLSYSDFVSKANKICADGNAAIAKADRLEEQGKTLEPYVKKFKDLEPPDALKPTYDEFVATSEQLVEKAKAGDTAGLQELSAKGDELGSKLGAQQCAGSQ